MNFHHLGYACLDIEEQSEVFIKLGYKISDRFTDHGIGVKGLFLEQDGHPRIELVQNLPDHGPLKNVENKFHHIAYQCPQAQSIDEICEKLEAFLVYPPTESEYFKKKIAFVMLRNQQIIELINVF